jgi:hypothetical protein
MAWPKTFTPSSFVFFWNNNDAARRVAVLFVGASLIVMAPSGARAEVRPVNLDGCSGDCGSNAMDGADSARDGAEAKIMMSLIGAGRSRGALLLDRDAVPTVLASGFPSALAPNGGNDAGAHNHATVVDFEYVFTHSDAVGDPTLFLSIASLTGPRTLGDVLSDFAAKTEAPSWNIDLVLEHHGLSPPAYDAPSWTEDTENSKPIPQKPEFLYPWMQYVTPPPK